MDQSGKKEYLDTSLNYRLPAASGKVVLAGGKLDTNANSLASSICREARLGPSRPTSTLATTSPGLVMVTPEEKLWGGAASVPVEPKVALGAQLATSTSKATRDPGLATAPGAALVASIAAPEAEAPKRAKEKKRKSFPHPSEGIELLLLRTEDDVLLGGAPSVWPPPSKTEVATVAIAPPTTLPAGVPVPMVAGGGPTTPTGAVARRIADSAPRFRASYPLVIDE
ncbi:hypothetical protein GGR53DRAFT_469950 [Hypoxylon sp. FL1150]|nr:hypothetical protein GGR53DRAFT_469950 [Hypoxylon sp. FL1150]